MIGMVEGAVILLIGMRIGWSLPGRRKIEEKPEVKPVCGCGHHHAYHTKKTGVCAGVNQIPVAWGAIFGSRPIRWDQQKCRCQQYSGPQALPEYYAPDVSS